MKRNLINFVLVPSLWILIYSSLVISEVLSVNIDEVNKEGLEMNWQIQVSNAVSMKRKILNIVLRQFEELSHTLPHITKMFHYLENLINSLALIHRLVKVWPGVRSLMKTAFGDLKVPDFPIDGTTIYGSAMRSLVRLQETYNISTEVLASGRIEGAYPETRMTVDTIMDVGVFYYRLGHPWRAVEWLLTALEKTTVDNSVSRKTILEYLSLAFCLTGDSKKSSNSLATLYEEYPSFTGDETLLEQYNLIANSSCKELNDRAKEDLNNDYTLPYLVDHQRGMCRQKNELPAEKSLKCRLIRYNRADLRLAPLMMEELHLDPPIILFHNVIHDQEIELIRRLYHNKTRPAFNDYPGVTPDDSFELQHNYRLNRTDPLYRLIGDRASKVTNAALYLSEALIVANYGLAGQIDFHSDGTPDESLIFRDDQTSSDYISLIFYLNDVTEGGYTIFPILQKTVVPAKGTALMWFNRLPDWTPDDRVKHAGCPVLQGTKWVNKMSDTGSINCLMPIFVQVENKMYH